MNKIIKGVKDYYTDKIKNNGVGAKGVDWNSKESQYLRFDQLCKVINKDQFSLIDYGCGYGELINYIDSKYSNYDYLGFDISDEMLAEAKKLFENNSNVKFSLVLDENKADYVIASGLFNVRLNLGTNEEWLEYILETLNNINSLSNGGFSFNALTKYSDNNYLKDYLYYSDPLFIFDYCKRNFSKNVALLHDYNLYEFTIIVRKDG